MNKTLVNKVILEMGFLVATAVIAYLMIQPIKHEFDERYLFYSSNIAFLFIFITFTRYIFLLKYTPFSHSRWIKVLLIFACIPLFLFMIDGFYNFQRFLDEVGLHVIASSSGEKAQSMCKYTRYQYLFFATGGLITMVLIPIRMVVSLWRQYNTDKV